MLSEAKDDLVIAVDTNWRESANRNRQADYVSCSMPNSRGAFTSTVRLQQIADHIEEAVTHGEWMGFLKISSGALPGVKALVTELAAHAENRSAKLPVLINALIARDQPVRVLYTTGHWLDIDSLADVVEAGNF